MRVIIRLQRKATPPAPVVVERAYVPLGPLEASFQEAHVHAPVAMPRAAAAPAPTVIEAQAVVAAPAAAAAAPAMAAAVAPATVVEAPPVIVVHPTVVEAPEVPEPVSTTNVRPGRESLRCKRCGSRDVWRFGRISSWQYAVANAMGGQWATCRGCGKRFITKVYGPMPSMDEGETIH